MKNNVMNWASIITLITTLFSLAAMIVYCTRFVSNIEERVSILEVEMNKFGDHIKEFKNDMYIENVNQDHLQHRFEDQINKKMLHLENKFNQIELAFNYFNENESTEEGVTYLCNVA